MSKNISNFLLCGVVISLLMLSGCFSKQPPKPEKIAPEPAPMSQSTKDLFLAIENKDMDAAFAALDEGADVNARQPKDNDLERLRGDNPKVNQLLDALILVANLYSGPSNSTPLHKTADWGNLTLFKALLVRGANITAVDSHGNTVLHNAASSQNYQIAREALVLGVPVDAPARYGTALQQAVPYTNLSFVKLLVDNGADVNYRSPQRFTPFLAAAQPKGGKDNRSILEFLVQHGANMSAQWKGGRNAMPLAATGNPSAVRFLIENGEDVNVRTDTGVTPLHTVARSVFRDETAWESARILIGAGADVNAKTDAGLTPVLTAIMAKNEDYFFLLVENGASIEGRTMTGETPLHIAAAKGMVKVAEYLLDNGADPVATTNLGETPLVTAIKNDKKRVADLLRKRGGYSQ